MKHVPFHSYSKGSHFRVLRHLKLLLGFVQPSLCHLSLSSACSLLHPSCSLTQLFIQAMLGGVSCSQGHPVLQLLPSVCFSSRFQGIYLGWGYVGVCVWRGPCEYISWSDQLPPNIKATQAQREAGLQVIYKNIFQYMCTQIAKVLNTNAGIAGCWCYSQEVII